MRVCIWRLKLKTWRAGFQKKRSAFFAPTCFPTDVLVLLSLFHTYIFYHVFCFSFFLLIPPSDPVDLASRMDSPSSAPPVWPLYVFYCMSLPSLPIYIMVLVCLLRLRCFSKGYRTTFYTILLQHCIADILAMIVFLGIWCLRMLPGLRQFYWDHQGFYIAAGTYNSIYFFLYIRCAGIVFLSLHRYLVISAPTHFLTSRIQEAATWHIVGVYWIVPILISIVVLKDVDFHYDALETMEVVAPRPVITRNTLMALIIVSLTCLVCVVSYVALWLFLREHTAGFSKSLQREMHLAFQVLALLCAFFVMFAYYVLQNYFSQTQNTGPIYTMRALYPIANGILSYINPFCILLLNRDFSRQFVRSLKCQGVRVSEANMFSTVNSSSHRHH